MGAESFILPDEIIESRIFNIRGMKVMIDSDLAELYGVLTKRLNEQVRRNINRFPGDFMFQLNENEKEQLLSAYPRLQRLKYASSLPYVFTEHGAVMLASVLNSDRAVKVNVQIVRIFIRMREMITNNREILVKITELEKSTLKNSGDIKIIFDYLRQLFSSNESRPAQRIGFKRNSEQ